MHTHTSQFLVPFLVVLITFRSYHPGFIRAYGTFSLESSPCTRMLDWPHGVICCGTHTHKKKGGGGKGTQSDGTDETAAIR
jgi:hypothetical protein